MVSPDLGGGSGFCLLFILASDLTILDHFPGEMDLLKCHSIFLELKLSLEILIS